MLGVRRGKFGELEFYNQELAVGPLIQLIPALFFWFQSTAKNRTNPEPITRKSSRFEMISSNLSRKAVSQESLSTLPPHSHVGIGSYAAPILAAAPARLPTTSQPFRPSPDAAPRLALQISRDDA